jgi:hypothetical protein
MAGLIGQAEWWADFADKWTACLGESPTIRYFKFYDASHRTGQFSGMSSDSRNKKLVALVKVLDEHPFVVLHITVNAAEYEKSWTLNNPTAASQPRRRRRFRWDGVDSNPYFYAYNSFVSAAAVHLFRRGEREQFDYIVDKHPSLGDRVKDWFPIVRATMIEPVRAIMPAEPIQRDDQQFMPLQAADLIAGIQREANTPPKGTQFLWLAEHFTQVKASEMCVYQGAEWFGSINQRAADLRAAGPPIEAMIQMARMEGAPIPAEGEPWPKNHPRKKGGGSQ